jgi:hypothetical protein
MPPAILVPVGPEHHKKKKKVEYYLFFLFFCGAGV